MESNRDQGEIQTNLMSSPASVREQPTAIELETASLLLKQVILPLYEPVERIRHTSAFAVKTSASAEEIVRNALRR